MIVLFLFLLGLYLVFLEFYLPGAVIGVIGGICLVLSLMLFISEQHGWIEVLLFLVGLASALFLTIRFALWRIVHVKPKTGIYSNQDEAGYQASSFDREAIGQEGVVLTDLKPGGYILIQGKPHPAISLIGYISKGETVSVVSGQGESLMVVPKKE